MATISDESAFWVDAGYGCSNLPYLSALAACTFANAHPASIQTLPVLAVTWSQAVSQSTAQ